MIASTLLSLALSLTLAQHDGQAAPAAHEGAAPAEAAHGEATPGEATPGEHAAAGTAPPPDTAGSTAGTTCRSAP